MKKSLLLMLFTFGILSFGFSQELTYYVENQTSIDWEIDLRDSGIPTSVNIPLGPGDIVQDVIDDFDFRLFLSADNNAGCSGTQTENGPTASSSIPLVCFSTYVIYYSITTTSTGYHLHLEISG